MALVLSRCGLPALSVGPLLLFLLAGVVQAESSPGTLLLQDDFSREEATPGVEDIGNGWTSNSARRAQGKQQVQLVDGAMSVTRAAEADHGVAIFHDVTFQDGLVGLKFKLGQGDDLAVDFVDRDLKTVHAGHLCVARVRLNAVSLTDSKTGAMDLEIRERRMRSDTSPELAALLKSKTVTFPLKLPADVWHHLVVEVVGEFRSSGVAHPTKRMITLAINKSAWVDDVEVRRLR